MQKQHQQKANPKTDKTAPIKARMELEELRLNSRNPLQNIKLNAAQQEQKYLANYEDQLVMTNTTGKEIEEVFDSLDSLIAASNSLMPPFKTDRLDNEPF